jgi:hypothetical protein
MLTLTAIAASPQLALSGEYISMFMMSSRAWETPEGQVE